MTSQVSCTPSPRNNGQQLSRTHVKREERSSTLLLTPLLEEYLSWEANALDAVENLPNVPQFARKCTNFYRLLLSYWTAAFRSLKRSLKKSKTMRRASSGVKEFKFSNDCQLCVGKFILRIGLITCAGFSCVQSDHLKRIQLPIVITRPFY